MTALGERIVKSISANVTSYLYDGANIVQELQGGNATANLLTGGIDEVFCAPTPWAVGISSQTH